MSRTCIGRTEGGRGRGGRLRPAALDNCRCGLQIISSIQLRRARPPRGRCVASFSPSFASVLRGGCAMGSGRRGGPTLSCPGIYVKSSLFVKEVLVKKILFVRKVVKTAFKLIKPDLVFSKSPLFTQENRDSRGLKIVYYFLLSVRTAGNTLYVFVEYVISAPSSCP